MIRVLLAPDPFGGEVVVAASEDTDEAIQIAMDAFVAEALADPLWEHLHERLRDPVGWDAKRQKEHRGPHYLVLLPNPTIGVYYTVVPMHCPV